MTGEAALRDHFDLLVVGGGVNGCAIARDAAGRGLRVCLVEAGDLAQGTSSASTKLFHGGLRYLDHFEFSLVRKALGERETLLRAMPHISRPMRFVLPIDPAMRFDAATPASRLIGRLAPWLKERRPAWMIRAGLFLYDRLAGRGVLPGTASYALSGRVEGAPLAKGFTRAFEYSDCWVDDARLVVLIARDAAARGARIETRTRLAGAERMGGTWIAKLQDSDSGRRRSISAHCLVNAAGPWAGALLSQLRPGQGAATPAPQTLRLVRGSHLVTRALFDHDKAYFFQGSDGRIIFAIPYEGEFTLIGTTEMDHPDLQAPAECSPQERDYLLKAAGRYFAQAVTPDDVIWSFAGIRPLIGDAQGDAGAVSRDYALRLEGGGDTGEGAPLLSVLGGKITTHRLLAEEALEKLRVIWPKLPGNWTEKASLPGGDFEVTRSEALIDQLSQDYPYLGEARARRMFRAYGTEVWEMLGERRSEADLGEAFGAGLCAAEVAWLMEHEFAQSARDVVWRRGKLGLKMTALQIERLDEWMRGQAFAAAAQ